MPNSATKFFSWELIKLMSEAAIQLERLPGETLAIHLSGKWQLGKDVPSADKKLAELPDGIHSGLVRPGNRGIFFYFQGRTEGGKKLDSGNITT